MPKSLLNKIPIKIWVIGFLYCAVLFLSAMNPFTDLELLTYDLRFKLRPPIKIADEILMINIDDQTLTELAQWPLPRDFHASLIDVLSKYQAKAVIFDIIFPEPSAYDANFSESIKKAGNVYLPVAFNFGLSNETELHNSTQFLAADITENLKTSPVANGHINVLIDQDGKTRRLPLFIKTDQGFSLPISLVVAQQTIPFNIENVKISTLETTINKGLKIPTADKNILIINYPEKGENTFQNVSYLDLLKKHVSIEEGNLKPSELQYLKDKICFIGLTATGTVDLRVSPLENAYPMVGVHASVLNSFLTGQYIASAGKQMNLLLNLIVFSISLFLCLKWKPLTAFLANIVLGLVYSASTIWLFNSAGLWVDLFLPIFLIALTYALSTAYRFIDEIKKRELIEQELNIAQKIQKSFLPERNKIPHLEIASFFQPAKFVAGDLYDVFELPDGKLGILVGDVAGKGVSAALVMAQAISLFRIFSRQIGECHEVLTRLNKELYGRLGGRFITALYIIVDPATRKVSAVSAGHGPLYIFRAAEKKLVEISLAGSVPLGLMDATHYSSITTDIYPGDRIFIFSDGLYEIRRKDGVELEMSKTKVIMEQHAFKNVDAALSGITQEILHFAKGASQHDDITFIILSLQESSSLGIMTATKGEK
jgi:CHASE2 domain-containing sensor protein